MRKFESVDIIDTLRKIVNNNTLFYQSDFEYDAETLKSAATNNGYYLWMSRNSGTWLLDERDVYIHNTYAHNTWLYYSNADYYGVKAFAVTVTGKDGDKPIGDIYELDYKTHLEEVNKASFNANTVDVTFKPSYAANETARVFDITEYDNNWLSIIERYGEVLSVKHNIEDENSLTQILDKSRSNREAAAIPAGINSYVQEIVKDRFHKYGYLNNDMVFTTPADVYTALDHSIPVYALHSDNTKERITVKTTAANYNYSGLMFGMSARDKQLLNFYKACSSLDNLPFTRDELKAIFYMALDKGKENISDEQERQTIDNIIQVLDKALFAITSHDELNSELSYELDERIYESGDMEL